MAHRPSGPRQKHGAPSSQAQARQPAPPPPTRDEAFSQIFGRRNTHHVNAAPAQQQQQQPAYGGEGYGVHTPSPPPPPPGGPGYPLVRAEGRYDQFAQSAGVGLPPGVRPAPLTGGSASYGGGGSYGGAYAVCPLLPFNWRHCSAGPRLGPVCLPLSQLFWAMQKLG